MVQYTLPSKQWSTFVNISKVVDTAHLASGVAGATQRPAARSQRRYTALDLGTFPTSRVSEAAFLRCRINFGPGYRVYFGKDGEQLVILLGGGTKKRQQNDINLALDRWEDHKQRKKRQKEKE
jgi:putative addiction module killer protein